MELLSFLMLLNLMSVAAFNLLPLLPVSKDGAKRLSSFASDCYAFELGEGRHLHFFPYTNFE